MSELVEAADIFVLVPKNFRATFLCNGPKSALVKFGILIQCHLHYHPGMAITKQLK
jgi:hypothetical protein